MDTNLLTPTPPPGLGDIVIRGARQHNLKNIDVVIPRHKLVVITGVSGSGKSSLAIDTLYAEGQRRYVESLSAYARQFIGQMEKPKVDQISGLSPAIAIEQKTVSRNPRSTVGTVTEVLDYLRVLYARVGIPHCPVCGRSVQPQSPLEIANQILAFSADTRFQILAPVVRARKGTQRNLLGQARRDGFRRVRIDGEMLTLDGNLPKLEKTKKHTVELVVDRLVAPQEIDVSYRQRVIDSVETAVIQANGLLIITLENAEILFSTHNSCPHCDISLPDMAPNLFSFNSPAGMCPDCNGLGLQLQVDPDLIITKPNLSLLDGASPTLSGGESQRIRLASQLGCGLVGVLYILDEPSIGLHPRDHQALLQTLLQLRDMGNTVVVIEHDEATMKAADWLIDLGPDAGVRGGELIACGSPDKVMKNPQSLTGRYLAGSLQVSRPHPQRRKPQGWLTLKGARLHNLKHVDTAVPLGVFCCVTGVSGSGKSSLIRQTLHPALARTYHNAQKVSGPHDTIEGLDQIDKVINITQDPIGRTPRSNPATYVGVYGEIRKLFASLPAAKARGYKAGRFSFNAKGGRCDACKGYGRKRVEMHFLADVWVICTACSGSRYNHQTLEITYRDKSIADVLEMEVQEALDFFASHPKIGRILQTLNDVGLEYIKLGQSALTLSGGEAQRVKLAKELSRIATGRTLYLLDEPTTGLHFADIQRLLDVLHKLVDAGNTVLVIEHNLDVVDAADYLIDLGPEGGDAGGYIIATGTPEAVAQVADSYTGQFLAQRLSLTKVMERQHKAGYVRAPVVPGEFDIWGSEQV